MITKEKVTEALNLIKDYIGENEEKNDELCFRCQKYKRTYSIWCAKCNINHCT